MQTVGHMRLYNECGAVIKFRVTWGSDDKHSGHTDTFSKNKNKRLDMNDMTNDDPPLTDGTTVWPQVHASGSVNSHQKPEENDYVQFQEGSVNVATYMVTGTVNHLDIQLSK